MQKFKSPEQVQRFLSSLGPTYEFFKPKRHLMKAADYRNLIDHLFQLREDVTAVSAC
jgi:putative transposase